MGFSAPSLDRGSKAPVIPLKDRLSTSNRFSSKRATRHVFFAGDEISILKSVLRDMDYVPPRIRGTNEQLESAMHAEMEERGLRSDRLKRSIHLAASLIEVGFSLSLRCLQAFQEIDDLLSLQWAYHDCDFVEKKNIALINWYGSLPLR